MAAPVEEQQPQASTSQTNGAAAPEASAGQAGPRKNMKEMTKGQSSPPTLQSRTHEREELLTFKLNASPPCS